MREEVALRKHLDFLKSGHAGTLDPFASGLLVIGVNKGTKVLSFFEEKNKSYQATIQLGMKSETGDIDGDKTDIKVPHKHTKEEINSVLSTFLGQTQQIPPMYSAIKKDGQPLYKLAHAGIEVERKPRTVTITKISLLNYDMENNSLSFECDVSKGTYIRTLGEDIASKLGENGYLSALRRTKVGCFDISQAKDSQTCKEEDIITIAELFKSMAQTIVDKQTEARIRNGAQINLQGHVEPVILVLGENKEALGIFEKADDSWYKPLKELF